MTRRVAVTGLGLITPLGNNVEDSWEAIKNGVSGLGPITHFDSSIYPIHIAAEVKNFNPADYMDRKEVRRTDPYQQYASAAVQQAVAQAEFEVKENERFRSSVIVGSSVGGMRTYYDYVQILNETNDPRRMTPFGITMTITDGASNIWSVKLRACGPSYVPVSACATGADCIGTAFDLIRNGRIDRAVAGAADFPILRMGIAVFDRAGACSKTQIRPFDKNREGLVFGEGSGVLVLEELEYAKARGANILAEIVGYGSTSDGVHITAPDPYGTGAAEAIRQALETAHLNPEDIDYINAHGTGTALNDKMETAAVKRALGHHAYNIPMSSTKSMTGHAMGGTAAMEAVFSVLSIRDNVAPPTINYETPDPECDLDCVPNEARELPISTVMSNSFGFGGHNASLIFKAFK